MVLHPGRRAQNLGGVRLGFGGPGTVSSSNAGKHGNTSKMYCVISVQRADTVLNLRDIHTRDVNTEIVRRFSDQGPDKRTFPRVNFNRRVGGVQAFNSQSFLLLLTFR